MRDRLQQELCQANFGRKRVTKLQSRLTFCHGRLFFSHFCCMDRKNVLHLHSERPEDGHTVDVAQLVRASDCGSEGRGFEPLLPPEEVSSKRGDLFFFASVRACRLGSLNARCARHLPHPTPGLCTARRSKRLPTATQPGLRPSTTESPDPRRNRFKGRTPFQPPPPPTDEPPPADKRAFRPTAAARIQRPYAAFPLRHNRPIFRNRHYPHKHLNLRNRHRPRPSASKRHKKTAVPALGTAVVSMLEPA